MHNVFCWMQVYRRGQMSTARVMAAWLKWLPTLQTSRIRHIVAGAITAAMPHMLDNGWVQIAQKNGSLLGVMFSFAHLYPNGWQLC